MSAGGINLTDTEPGDMIVVLRPDSSNPHAVKQFARILKHALRIHGLRCVDVRQVQLQTFPHNHLPRDT